MAARAAGIVGFDACNACIDAKLGDELKREFGPMRGPTLTPPAAATAAAVEAPDGA